MSQGAEAGGLGSLRPFWRGSAQAWECDELGHLNVRFYLSKAMQALGGLAEAAGMVNAFKPSATATLILREAHLRYHAEIMPGMPLVIRGCVESFDETQLTAAFVMTHAGTGAVHASQRLTVSHAGPDSGKPFAFAKRTRDMLQELSAPTPTLARMRGVTTEPADPDSSLERADVLGLEETGRGRIDPADVDVFGRLRAEQILGKVSDTVINFSRGLPEQWRTSLAGERQSIASAVLEARILVRRMPRAGSGYVMRSGVTSVKPKTRQLVHWVLDSHTGAALWSMEGVVCMMDLDARTLVAPDAATLEHLKAMTTEGLRA
ncbi:MAG: acyl-ACP thioesterase [Pseudomonadota bacterium]